ncbi:MAG: flagellar M-ring protein FliF [Planctomycetes bacterium]|nr:flagellar M-ring protein FliF [Planctomycetota bacterium]
MKELITQFKNIWNAMPLGQKVAGMGFGLLLAGAVVVLAIVGSAPDWRVIAAQVDRAEAQKLLARLEEAAIPFKLEDDGRTVLVPADSMSEVQALVVKNDLLSSDSGRGYKGLEATPFGMSEAQLKLKLRVAQEEQLALSLERFENVEKALVHITPAVKSWNRQDSKPAKASVMVQTKPGRMMTVGEVESVIQMVAHAVESLDPENVVVSDFRGSLLSRTSGADRGMASRAVRAREEEMHLQEKAESALVQVLGPGKAVVRVDADLDLEKSEEVRHTVDPESRVVVSETQRTQSSTRGASGAGGAAKGQPSTVAVQSGTSQSGSGSDTSTEDLQARYDYGRSDITTVRESGEIRRLTIGMVLDESMKDRGEALSGVVKGAVGFDVRRGDTLEVAYVPFALPMKIEAPVEIEPGTTLSLQEWLRWGVTAFVAILLVGWMVLSVRRARRHLAAALTPTAHAAEVRMAAEAKVDPRADLRRLVDEDVDTVAKVMRNWLYEPAGKR